MDILTSQYLEIGKVYSRTYLAEMFRIKDSTVKNAIFKPKEHRSVWIWAAGDSDHEDKLEGNMLDLCGQTHGGADGLITGEKHPGSELLVFYHHTEKEFGKSNYQYLGRFRYVRTHIQGKPSRFTLEAIDELPTEPATFAWVDADPAEATPLMDLAKISTAFGQSLIESHIDFGEGHDRVVRSFLSSLITKRFVILTGLSGSGKTQIALRFGEWLGKGRSLPVAVRPDWTGSEALFGYEDALQTPLSGGRRPWYAPDALAFMLTAANDASRPYLLILDEMNLAHVERYFADVLSGMESDAGCLPNLKWINGRWLPIPGGEEKIPYPNNLFVVGTVNVDETTYMFSPKVLDRANTFEFRVLTDDLDEDARKPERCKPGKAELVAGFLALSKDQNWQHNHKPAWFKEFSSSLRLLHELLSAGSFEFGHRVFYEALRFAALASASGIDSMEEVLDLQVMQKVLPRLHGSQRRLEPTLRALGRFCVDLTFEKGAPATAKFNPLADPGKVKLAQSFEKVQRMFESLQANQYASFTN